jgi:ATP-dependent Lhr-like helicase
MAAERLGEPVPRISVQPTGDTPSEDRCQLPRASAGHPDHYPESLYLMLTSAAQEVLRGVVTVIVDESMPCRVKRGAHLASPFLEALRRADTTCRRSSGSGCRPPSGRS